MRPDGTLSLYTFHLLEALAGAGNRPGDTVVRLSHLMNHLGQAVPASARPSARRNRPHFSTPRPRTSRGPARRRAGASKEGWPTAPASGVTYQATLSGSGAIAQGRARPRGGRGGEWG
ncbi:MAG: hypothetical protein HZY76_16540 [Anaerolineae bacterium]|nr:MAG: hypothetical protein HZY76_16540 [Anaerolineae bacterium]